MKDEILGKALASDSEIIPRYTIRDANGNVVAQNATIELDNPITQAGTPINKATMLTDETAADVWAGETPQTNPTVDEALDKLSWTFEPGDIKTTLRTNLPDNWLLANGENVKKTDYPNLVNTLTEAYMTEKWPWVEYEEFQLNAYSGAAASNRRGWLVYITSNGIAFSLDLLGDVVVSHSLGALGTKHIKYTGGYYVVFTQDSSGGFWYTADPSQGWTRVLYSSVITSPTSAYYVTDVEYGNGVFAFVGYLQTSPSFGTTMAYIFSGSSLAGPFTTTSIPLGELGVTGMRAAYQGGRWHWLIGRTYNNTNQLYLYRTDSSAVAAGSQIYSRAFENATGSGGDNALYIDADICIVGAFDTLIYAAVPDSLSAGTVVDTGSGGLIYRQTITRVPGTSIYFLARSGVNISTGTKTLKRLDTATGTLTGLDIQGTAVMAFGNDRMFMMAPNPEGTWGGGMYMTRLGEDYTLPTITADGAYAYIRGE